MTESNQIAEIASKYVNTTNQHVFLTGKAGTGKTTFLRNIVDNTFKKAAIAAPTGIAAINAGGVTLHSLLQLPFGVYIPDASVQTNGLSSERINTPQTLFSNFKLNKTKRKLLQEIELLIIDEVSMLRADLLDCIDAVLRHVRRRKQQPFGGLQILFIGDLLQLPPVVKDSERQLLGKYYHSNYFFAAHALNNTPPLYIELDKIYRQSDQDFIDTLNRFRNNAVTKKDIEYINSFYKPDFKPADDEKFIQITTHNYKADEINASHLADLQNKAFTFQATIENDFPESMYPVQETLTLKKGAQVMFLKNDGSEEKRFFNGKIGEVTDVSHDHLEVTCPEDSEPIVVESYTWQNIRYTLNKETNEIEEKVIGQFKQYPLKLAWAVTVHKSQGLTFERAILDLGDSFAAGQVYVALSRLTSPAGLVLSSPISSDILRSDAAIADFAQNKKPVNTLNEQLGFDQKKYIENYTIESFNFFPLISQLKNHLASFNKEENKSAKQQYADWTQKLLGQTAELKSVADTFIKQVRKIVATEQDYLKVLQERVHKASNYFDTALKKVKAQIDDHIDEVKIKSKVKQYTKELSEIEAAYFRQQQAILKIDMFLTGLINDEILDRQQLQNSELYKNRKAVKAKSTKDKTPTREITFKLHKEGLDIETIAVKRNLVPGTIAGHLCYYIGKGQIAVNQFIDDDKLKNILTVSKTLDTDKMGEIKGKLGDEYSYSDIKFALAHKRSLSESKG